MIAVDSSVWMPALRRRRAGIPEAQSVQFLRALIAFGREVVIPAPTYQELLASARNLEECERLETTLQPFPVLEGTRADFADAGRLGISARRAGLALTDGQLLTAAIVIARGARLFTVEPELLALAEQSPLEIVVPRA